MKKPIARSMPSVRPLDHAQLADVTGGDTAAPPQKITWTILKPTTKTASDDWNTPAV